MASLKIGAMHRADASAVQARRAARPKRIASRALYQLLVLISVGIVLMPLLWIVLSSVKPYADIFAVPPRFFPSRLTFENFTQALGAANFQRYFVNSFVYAGGSAVIDVVLGAPAAYALSKFRFVGRRALLLFVLGTQFFPAATLLIPLYKFWSSVHLFNTYPSLVITYAAFTMPVCIWLLIGFFRAISAEIEDAAAIDGCSALATLFRITLPLARAGIVACAAYVFINVWQDFLLALTLTTTDDMRPVSVGLYSFIGQFVTQWNLLMAASVAVAVPVLVLFLLIQRYFIEGLAAGAIK
jgi:multiple sugar transport system permease protein